MQCWKIIIEASNAEKSTYAEGISDSKMKRLMGSLCISCKIVDEFIIDM